MKLNEEREKNMCSDGDFDSFWHIVKVFFFFFYKWRNIAVANCDNSVLATVRLGVRYYTTSIVCLLAIVTSAVRPFKQEHIRTTGFPQNDGLLKAR